MKTGSRMSKGIFITATDTGVGKTVVSAAIIGTLKRRGINAGAMKPIETGCSRVNGILEPGDGAYLKAAAGMDDPLELITPVRFEAPLAPYVASREEGIPVAIGSIFKAFHTLCEKYEFMVVEGIGGVLVPLARSVTGKTPDTYFVVDLIKDLKLSSVVIARPSLGTINHTLLTVSRLLDDGIDVVGVIINFSKQPEGDIAEKTNHEALRDLCPVPIIGTVPYREDCSIESIDSNTLDCIDINSIIQRR
jgi:dethiobiotin synthetase